MGKIDDNPVKWRFLVDAGSEKSPNSGLQLSVKTAQHPQQMVFSQVKMILEIPPALPNILCLGTDQQGQHSPNWKVSMGFSKWIPFQPRVSILSHGHDWMIWGAYDLGNPSEETRDGSRVALAPRLHHRFVAASLNHRYRRMAWIGWPFQHFGESKGTGLVYI